MHTGIVPRTAELANYFLSENAPKRRAKVGEPENWLLTMVQTIQTVEQAPTPCIYFPFLSNEGGYGRQRRNGRNVLSHRWAWELFHAKDVPRGMLVLHTCHSGHLGCCNPKHLKLGTDADNNQDKMDAKRNFVARGLLNGNAIADQQSIELLLSEYTRTRCVSESARRAGLSRGSSNLMITGTSWTHITIPFYQNNPEQVPHPSWLGRHRDKLTTKEA